jgi:hypothetical protein
MNTKANFDKIKFSSLEETLSISTIRGGFTYGVMASKRHHFTLGAIHAYFSKSTIMIPLLCFVILVLIMQLHCKPQWPFEQLFADCQVMKM